VEAVAGVSALGAGAFHRGAFGVGVLGVGVRGVGDFQRGAFGVGAFGVGALGVGALGVGAFGVGALGVGDAVAPWVPVAGLSCPRVRSRGWSSGADVASWSIVFGVGMAVVGVLAPADVPEGCALEVGSERGVGVLAVCTAAVGVGAPVARLCVPAGALPDGVPAGALPDGAADAGLEGDDELVLVGVLGVADVFAPEGAGTLAVPGPGADAAAGREVGSGFGPGTAGRAAVDGDGELAGVDGDGELAGVDGEGVVDADGVGNVDGRARSLGESSGASVRPAGSGADASTEEAGVDEEAVATAGFGAGVTGAIAGAVAAAGFGAGVAGAVARAVGRAIAGAVAGAVGRAVGGAVGGTGVLLGRRWTPVGASPPAGAGAAWDAGGALAAEAPAEGSAGWIDLVRVVGPEGRWEAADSEVPVVL
jgi:hypothetical protein